MQKDLSPRSCKGDHSQTEGRVIRDSYGAAKQQHTFTLEAPDGSTFRIKGRNLYRNGCYRLPWENESQRIIALDEKHERGDRAREDRNFRKSGLSHRDIDGNCMYCGADNGHYLGCARP